MTLTLRHAVADDLTAVGALHQRSRVAAYSPFLPPEALAVPTPEAMGEYWTQRWPYERDDHLMTVAERAGRLVGFSYVGPDELDGVVDPTAAMLRAIHLEPTEQGRGTGRALMLDALHTMRSWGHTRATLWVLRDNAHARRFYERGGWTPDGLERDDHIGLALVPQLRYARAL
ncbi:GNAT family N-acetyltransferase [Micromonospora sp. WMMD882]|uniref:GNAT family N-acetyltransferase n=1 Tax=Micromonospora sp. WMMD882 TaxID=3015151 RepID=UPI00248B4F25|nr:GNAT family N-acetyltransferase [Micromonospora sp. WMMD882]WBB77422.1 GNAT family N-acetyltransferase [Micromonospora sp. WMMD882]